MLTLLTPELIARARHGDLNGLGEVINKIIATDYLTIQELVEMYQASGLSYALAARACSEVRTDEKLQEARKVIRRQARNRAYQQRHLARQLSSV